MNWVLGVYRPQHLAGEPLPWWAWHKSERPGYYKRAPKPRHFFPADFCRYTDRGWR